MDRPQNSLWGKVGVKRVFSNRTYTKQARSSALTQRILKRFARCPQAWISLAVLIALVLTAILAPYVAPYNPLKIVGGPLLTPQARHLLGTDAVGRDLLSRVIYGGRVSFAVGFLAATISMAVAVPLALIVGTRGGFLQAVIMRTSDGLLAFPTIIIALAVVSVVKPTILSISGAISIAFCPRLLRLIRSEVIAVAKNDYVEAARAIGASQKRILFRCILPNVVSPILVGFSIYFATAILMEAGLSFLGFGVAPPTPTWGFMISEGLSYLRRAPWHSISPGFAIFVAALALNQLGDALRDILDPRMRVARDS